MTMTQFEEVDARIRAIGAQLVAVGDALLHRPGDVSVICAEGEFPPDTGSDNRIGIDAPLPTKDDIRGLLVDLHSKKP